VAALQRLDHRPEVQVIVIARGGGSVEDLLPFSNEALIRAVAACRTPVVSAIGHESDQPLLDLVADLAASTPTDAAKQIVPDLLDELRQIADARQRLRSSIHRRLDTEAQLMAGLPERLRRSLSGLISARQAEGAQWVSTIRGRLGVLLDRASAENDQLLARVVSLSPQAVLNRGYAVVWDSERVLVRDPEDTFDGEPLRVRVAAGEFTVVVGEPEEPL
jgi:exodeoxyribonuclease VII large subunit